MMENNNEFESVSFEGDICGVSQSVTNFTEEQKNLDLFSQALLDLNSKLDAFGAVVTLLLAQQPRASNFINNMIIRINSISNQANTVLKSKVSTLYSINESLEPILRDIREQCDELLIEVRRLNENEINKEDFAIFIRTIESTKWIRDYIYQFVTSEVWQKITGDTFF